MARRKHRITKAEREAAAEQRKLDGQRAASDESMNAALNAWWQEVGQHPKSDEIAGSPLGASMIITSQFDSARGAKAHFAMDGAFEVDGERVRWVAGDVPVVATLSGRVLSVRWWDDDSGYSVLVGGDDGKIYAYSHLRLESVKLKVGDRVEQTQTIGMLGHTGNAKHQGDLVHYTVREFNPKFGRNGPVALNDFLKVDPIIDGKAPLMGMIFEPTRPDSFKEMMEEILATIDRQVKPLDHDDLKDIIGELPPLPFITAPDAKAQKRR